MSASSASQPTAHRPPWRSTPLPAAALLAAGAVLALSAAACTGEAESDGAEASGPAAAGALPPCDPDDGGLSLPDGFCATVVAEGVGDARHLTVAPNGDVYVAAYSGNGTPGGVVALRDTTGDGKADVRLEYPSDGGTGITLHDGDLYFATDWGVLRYGRSAGSLELQGPPDTVVYQLPDSASHNAKSAVVDGGWLYVNIGAPSNSCQEQDRAPGSPGIDPCPQLERRGGIWRFRADATGQTQPDGERLATGLRNTFALDVSPVNGDLYGGMHGRDQLYQNWGEYYTAKDGAELPSEELVRIDEGDDFGWPYCYHDWRKGELVLAPEYGGDGEKVGRCEKFEEPVTAFPGHWAPNGLVFYDGEQFPGEYRNGAFVAWHGSWNRAPRPQEGYKVSFVPWEGDELSSDYRADWATGFPGGEKTPRGAEHRPSGLAVGPRGSLYVSDDQAGTIWQITYRGTN